MVTLQCRNMARSWKRYNCWAWKNEVFILEISPCNWEELPSSTHTHRNWYNLNWISNSLEIWPPGSDKKLTRDITKKVGNNHFSCKFHIARHMRHFKFGTNIFGTDKSCTHKSWDGWTNERTTSHREVRSPP